MLDGRRDVSNEFRGAVHVGVGVFERETPPVRIAVTGASGVLGRVLVEVLRARGADVCGIGRGEGPPGVRWRRANACDPQAMTQALAGMQVVVHAASAGMSDPGAEITFAQAVVDAARANRLAHVVYVSINNVDRNAFFPLYAAKVGAETVVAESALPYTVQRIAQFHPFVAHVIALLSRGPFAVFPPGAALQPIDVRAAAERLADVALGAPRGRARSLAGPEDLELTTMYAQWKRARGIRKPALTLPIPLPAARALADRRQIDPTAERLGPTWEEWIAANARLPDLYARPHRTS